MYAGSSSHPVDHFFSATMPSRSVFVPFPPFSPSLPLPCFASFYTRLTSSIVPFPATPSPSTLFNGKQDAAQLRFHSLPSASYASTPSLLSARVAPTPSSASPADEAPPSSSSPSSAPPAAGFSTLAAVSSPPAASEPSAPPPVHRELPNLAWYTRGDHTTSYFYKEDEVQLLISRALSSLNAKKREAGEAEVVLEGGTTMHEREMFNRKEDWGCTRRFVGGRWTRVQ